MKLTVLQSDLAKALGAVSRIASAKAGMPILANVLLRTDDTRLIVAATNLEVVIVDTIGAQVDSEGAIAVPARLLTDFVNNLPHTNVEINTEENRLLISAGGYKSTINSQAADDYPAIPESNETNELTLPCDTLKEAISETVLATSNDVTRPILTGVYFHTVDGQLYLAATDGYRLAERKLMAIDQSIDMIVPAGALQDAIRVISGGKDVTVRYSDDQISFIVGDARVTSRLIDGKFINYRQLIPEKTEFSAKMNRDEFVRITKMAELFSREAAGTVIVENKQDYSTVSVRSITSQIGDNASSIEAEVTGGDTQVGLNSKYLVDALNCLKGEQISMGYNGKLTPVLLMGENLDYRHIIMPVKS